MPGWGREQGELGQYPGLPLDSDASEPGQGDGSWLTLSPSHKLQFPKEPSQKLYHRWCEPPRTLGLILHKPLTAL